MNEKCMIDGRDFKRERESVSGKNKERKIVKQLFDRHDLDI
jgi:hypothetical protein